MTSKSTSLVRTSEDALAAAIIAHLDASTRELPRDVSERLKSARAMALAKRHMVAVQTAAGVSHPAGNVAALQPGGASDGGFWGRLGAWVPLVALVAGLIAIGVVQENIRAQELAEIDAALLTDELPPTAYTDPGFAQFLRANRAN